MLIGLLLFDWGYYGGTSRLLKTILACKAPVMKAFQVDGL